MGFEEACARRCACILTAVDGGVTAHHDDRMVSWLVAAHSEQVTPSVSGIQMSSSIQVGRARWRPQLCLRGVPGEVDAVAFVTLRIPTRGRECRAFVVDHQDVCYVVRAVPE